MRFLVVDFRGLIIFRSHFVRFVRCYSSFLAFSFCVSHNFGKWVVPLCSSRENIEVRLLDHSIWISDEDYTELKNLEIFFNLTVRYRVVKLHNDTVWKLESGTVLSANFWSKPLVLIDLILALGCLTRLRSDLKHLKFILGHLLCILFLHLLLLSSPTLELHHGRPTQALSLISHSHTLIFGYVILSTTRSKEVQPKWGLWKVLEGAKTRVSGFPSFLSLIF